MIRAKLKKPFADQTLPCPRCGSKANKINQRKKRRDPPPIPNIDLSKIYIRHFTCRSAKCRHTFETMELHADMLHELEELYEKEIFSDNPDHIVF